MDRRSSEQERGAAECASGQPATSTSDSAPAPPRWVSPPVTDTVPPAVESPDYQTPSQLTTPDREEGGRTSATRVVTVTVSECKTHDGGKSQPTVLTDQDVPPCTQLEGTAHVQSGLKEGGELTGESFAPTMNTSVAENEPCAVERIKADSDDAQSPARLKGTVLVQTDSKEREVCTSDSFDASSSIPVSENMLYSAEGSKTDADDVHMENVCDRDSPLQVAGYLGTGDKLTQVSHSQLPDTVCISSDIQHSLSSGDRIEKVDTTEQDSQMKVSEDVNIDNAGEAPCQVSHSLTAPEQFQSDSVVEEPQNSRNEMAELTTDSVGGECGDVTSSAVSESRQCDGDGDISGPRETDKGDVLISDLLDKDSCDPSACEDEDDDEDIITLSESDFMPSLVITNVCSVRDDGTFMFDDDEAEDCSTGIQGTEHQSVSSDSVTESATAVTKQETIDRLPDVTSVTPPGCGIQETPSENRTDIQTDLPAYPSVNSSSPSSEQATGPAEESVTKSLTKPHNDADPTSALSTNMEEENAGIISESLDTTSPELSEDSREEQGEHTTAEQNKGSGVSSDQTEDNTEASGSLVVKLEPDDTGYETGSRALPLETDSIDVYATPDSCNVERPSESNKRKRSFSPGNSDSPKKRVFKVTCTDGYTFVSNVPGKGMSHWSGVLGSNPAGLIQRKSLGDTCSVTDSVNRAGSLSADAGLQPQSPALYSMLSKPLMIPSNLAGRKGVTLSHNIASKSVFLTIPPTIGGNRTSDTERTTHRATRLSQNVTQRRESSGREPGDTQLTPHRTTRLSQNVTQRRESSGREPVGTVNSTNRKAQEGVKTCVQFKPRSAHDQRSLLKPGSAVNKAVPLRGGIQRVQEPSSMASIPASCVAAEPYRTSCMSSALTSDVPTSVIVRGILQDQDVRGNTGPAGHGTPVLSPVMTEARQSSSRLISLTHIGQAVSVCKESVVSVTVNRTSSQPVVSVLPLTSVTCAGVQADTIRTVPQTPVSSSQKPASTTVRILAPGQVVFRTPRTSEKTETASSHTPSPSGAGSKPPQLIAESATPAVVSETIASGSKQHIRLDQVSSEAKLSASDIATLIQGKNLVPSLGLRPRPGRTKSNSVYRCVECGIMCSTLIGYTAHVKRMSMVIRYACMVCKAALLFFNKCTFLAHLRRHTTLSASGGQVLNLKSYTMSVSSLPDTLLPPVEVQYMDPLSMNRSSPVACTECEEMFPDTSKLALHFSSEVLYCSYACCTFEHACQHCNMQLPTPCALKAHLRLHDTVFHTFCARSPFVCPECGLQFVNQLSLCQHLYATCLHFNRCVNLHCFACNAWYPTLDTLEDHIYLYHPNKKLFRCLLCTRTYDSHMLFIHHISQVHRGVTYKIPHRLVPGCTVCRTDSDLVEGREHAKKHVEQAKSQTWYAFTCLFCEDFVSMSQHELLQHLSQKHAAYKFTCTICQEGFVTLSLLRAHVLSTHSAKNGRDGGERADPSFQCSMCSAASLNSESALPHVMWHVVKKVTEVADSFDSSSRSINKQSMEVVTQGYDKQKDKWAYFCRWCGFITASNQELQHHIAKQGHLVCGKFPTCPYCQRFDFANRYSFRLHTKACAAERGDEEVCYQTAQGEENSGVMTSRPEQQSDGCPNSGTAASGLGEPTTAETSKSLPQSAHEEQNQQQSARNSSDCSTLGNRDQGEDRVQCSAVDSQGLTDREKATRSTSAGQAASKILCSVVTGSSAQGPGTKSTCPVVPAQVSQEPGEKSASSSSPGLSSPNKGKKSISSKACGQKTQDGSEESSGSNICGQTAQKDSKAVRPFPHLRTIVIFTKNGKIVGHRELENVSESGTFKQNTKPSKTAHPAKPSVIRVMPQFAGSTLVPAGAAEKSAIPGSLSSREIQSTSSQLQLAKGHPGPGEEEEEEEEDSSTPETAEELISTARFVDTSELDSPRLYHPCHLCGLTYTSADQLASHHASVHRGQKTVLSCQVCQKKGKTVMLSKMNLKRHLLRRHNLAKPVAENMVSGIAAGQTATVTSPGTQAPASPVAKRNSTDSDSSNATTLGAVPVKRLRITEGDQQEYVCAKCKFSSLSTEEFHTHIETHAVASSVQCLECGLCFSAISSMKKHLFMVHKVKQPDAYIAEHGIKMKGLPADLTPHRDTLAPPGEPEVVIRTAGVFHEGFHKSPPLILAEKMQEKEPGGTGGFLECNVCYKEFENESALKSHMRTHGMAFIRSRRSTPQQDGEKISPGQESVGVASSGDQQHAE